MPVPEARSQRNAGPDQSGNAMNPRIACLLLLVFTVNAATAFAQPVGLDESQSPRVSPTPTPPLPLPEPPVVNPPPEPRGITAGPCDLSGCWATDGTRYDRAGGNSLIGKDGKVCQYVGQGLPLACP
jgi:hypothetical protein